jgi:ABC-type nitrate/sulfonate/bicarbonate transport system ATPase subunit
MMNRLTVSGVSRKFVSGARVNSVLNDISFTVDPGEVVALFGPNGCGKSTLFQILARLDTGYEGTLDLGKAQDSANVGYVFQNYTASLFPWLTLRENIAFPRELRNGVTATGLLGESPQQILRRFKLEDFADHYPYQVSGGMQQRVCFGRTVAMPQDLLLLDEPFSALDTGGFAQLLETFESISRDECPPTLLICHDLDQAMVFSDRVVVLSPRPASVVADIAIEFPRPRSPGLLLAHAFQKVRRSIMEMRLKTEMASARQA